MQLLRDLLDAEWMWNQLPTPDWQQGKANARKAAQDKDRARDAIVAYVERLVAEAVRSSRDESWHELDRMEREEMLTLDACREVGWIPLVGSGALARRIREAVSVPPEAQR